MKIVQSETGSIAVQDLTDRHIVVGKGKDGSPNQGIKVMVVAKAHREYFLVNLDRPSYYGGSYPMGDKTLARIVTDSSTFEFEAFDSLKEAMSWLDK